jgi:hypothetical protein
MYYHELHISGAVRVTFDYKTRISENIISTLQKFITHMGANPITEPSSVDSIINMN